MKANSGEELLQLHFKAVDEDRQLVFGEVYAPNMVDTDWEAMTPEDVEFAAHNFIKEGKHQQIDVNHDLQPSGAAVVESYIVRWDDPNFTKGSWVMGVWVPDHLWPQVKEGELNGFSFYGFSAKHPVKVVVEVARIAVGDTEPNASVEPLLKSHKHAFAIRFDDSGKILSGYTDFIEDHQHTVTLTTATKEAMGHSHRYFVE